MGVGDLRETRRGWSVEPPRYCHQMHELTPGHVQVGRLACTTHTGGHLTWRCDCGDVTYSPPTDPFMHRCERASRSQKQLHGHLRLTFDAVNGASPRPAETRRISRSWNCSKIRLTCMNALVRWGSNPLSSTHLRRSDTIRKACQTPCQAGWAYPADMASVRPRKRKKGGYGYAVLYGYNKQQTSTTFDSKDEADEFALAVNTMGAERAMKAWDIKPTTRAVKKEQGLTVTEWVQHHIDHLTGIQPATKVKYQAYLDNDITPHLGDIPLAVLSREDVVSWIQVLDETGVSGKTIKNKANFLSGCLNAAIPDKILHNPFTRVRLPEWKRAEKTYLTREEFDLLQSCVTEYWRPLVEFLVSSGLRWGEATALQPADINIAEGEVRCYQAWKYVPGQGWVLGTTKSRKSVRTINVPTKVLKKLDLSHEYVFVNRDGKPVRIQGFHRRVWAPARARAIELGLKKNPRIHDLRHTAVSWLMNAGAELPAIQAMVGHTSISTTIDVYSSLDRRAAKKLAELMDKQLS